MKRMGLCVLSGVVALVLGACMGGESAHSVLAQVDEVATAAAPWQPGQEVVVPESVLVPAYGQREQGFYEVYRRFLGVTVQGGYLVQDFYRENNAKYSDPYVLIDRTEVLKTGDVFEGGYASFSGELSAWYPGGAKFGEVSFLNGVPDGRWAGWYEGGQPSFEMSFEKGMRQGLYSAWFEDGQKRSEGYFVDDQAQGMQTEWYGNGQKRQQVFYQDGKAQGMWHEWYPNGQPLRECEFHDGENGFCTGWHDNGRKAMEGELRQGLPVGVWRHWDEDGDSMEGGGFGDMTSP